MKVREVMTTDVEAIAPGDTIQFAARRMRDLDVGSLPICGADNELSGMVTDRDITIHCVAEGADPRSTDVGLFATGAPVTVLADDPIEAALATMARHQVRRLPVVDENRRLVGILAQGDAAITRPAETGHAVASISIDRGG